MRSSRGHSTASLKISCKSVESLSQNKPFSHNVADKEISIAASRGFSELTQNVVWWSHGQSTLSLKISYKSVQPFCQNKPFCSNVADKEISIAASRGFSELTQNVIRSSHGQCTPSLKISCKSVQPFCLDTKRHRRQTDDRLTTCCTKVATDSTAAGQISPTLFLYDTINILWLLISYDKSILSAVDIKHKRALVIFICWGKPGYQCFFIGAQFYQIPNFDWCIGLSSGHPAQWLLGVVVRAFCCCCCCCCMGPE